MSLSRTEVDDLLYFAAFSAASRLGIEDIESKPLEAVTSAVVAKNDKLGAALECFLAAYTTWFAYSEKLEAEGKFGNLTSSENAKLIELMEQRDTRRVEFIQALQSAA